jgi:hypothetical protein
MIKRIKRIKKTRFVRYTLKLSCTIKAHLKQQTFTNSMIIRAKLSEHE